MRNIKLTVVGVLIVVGLVVWIFGHAIFAKDLEIYVSGTGHSLLKPIMDEPNIVQKFWMDDKQHEQLAVAHIINGAWGFPENLNSHNYCAYTINSSPVFACNDEGFVTGINIDGDKAFQIKGELSSDILNLKHLESIRIINQPNLKVYIDFEEIESLTYAELVNLPNLYGNINFLKLADGYLHDRISFEYCEPVKGGGVKCVAGR